MQQNILHTEILKYIEIIFTIANFDLFPIYFFKSNTSDTIVII